MSRQEIIKIPYIGGVLSVNHYLGRNKKGGLYIKKEVLSWKAEFQWLLKKCHLEEYKLPLHVTCSGYFKDLRSAPDLSNLSKISLDSIQELTGINDKNFRWHDGERLTGYKEPYLIIKITGSKPDTPTIAQNDKSDKVKRRS